jgi:hypothetical protein
VNIREWELIMHATGATRVRVGTVRLGEYTAEALVSNSLVEVAGETMDAVRGSLLERCQAASGITLTESDDDIPF